MTSLPKADPDDRGAPALRRGTQTPDATPDATTGSGPASPDPWAPLREEELHVEPLVPFTWRTTAWSVALWPLGAAWILGGYALVWVLDKTVLPGPRMYRLPKLLAKVALNIAGIRVRPFVHPAIDTSATYVFVPNHVTMGDAPVLSVAAPMNARAFQEKRHLKIPIFGGLTKLFGEVLIDPQDKALNERAHQEALRRIRGGMSWLVFPEGSRSFDGKLGRFFPGAFRLAIEAQVPVVPVAIRGARNLCPPGEWRGRPGVVQVIYGAPIPTTELGPEDVERLSHRARRAVNDTLRDGPGSLT